MNPKVLSGLSETERAYFESGGTVDPVTGKPAEETNDAGTDQPNAPDNPTGSGEAEQADPATQEATEQPDDGDEEVVDVANADGETRRKMIAFGAYEKQRKQSKALKAELEKMQQQMAYMSGLMQRGQVPTQTPQGQPQTTTAAPDPQKEPEKWLNWVNQTLAKVHQTEQQSQVRSAEQQQLDALNAAAYQAEQEFVSDHADYYDALKHLDKERRDELRDAGYDPQTIQQIIDAQNRDIAIRALNNHGNPAEKFYALAKRRGFKAPKPTPPKETEAEKVARQAQNQKTNKSIASLAGSGSGELTIEALANMAPHEFNKLWKEGKAQELMGIPT